MQSVVSGFTGRSRTLHHLVAMLIGLDGKVLVL